MLGTLTGSDILKALQTIGQQEQLQQEAQPTWSQKWLTGYTDPNSKLQVDGFAHAGLDLAGGLFDGYLGMKQYGLAKDQLNFQKKAFNTNLENQRSLTNTQLRDRQRAAVQFDPSFQSVSAYMKENGI